MADYLVTLERRVDKILRGSQQSGSLLNLSHKKPNVVAMWSFGTTDVDTAVRDALDSIINALTAVTYAGNR